MKFLYSGEARYYPQLGLEVEDGQVVDLDEAPDERFSKSTRKSNTATDVAAADPEVAS